MKSARTKSLANAGTLCLWFLMVTSAAGIIDSDRLHTETGISTGLCVLVACDDALAAVALASPGRMIVHALETSEQKNQSIRELIRSRGVYGLASSERVSSLRMLPYANNLVNLLVMNGDDPDAQILTSGEIERVLVPGGVSYVRKAGVWSKQIKKMPAGMDEWRMQNHGPDGNPLSQDMLVNAPTSVKWLAWYGQYANNGEGLHGPTYYEIRAGGGRVFQHFRFKNDALRVEEYPIDARDAFNGIALWQLIPTTVKKPSRGFCPLLVEKDRFFTVVKANGPLVELGAATGVQVRSFDKAGTLTALQQSVYPVWVNGSIIQSAGNRLVRFNPDDGNVQWEYREDTVAIAFPAVSQDKGKVFALVGLTSEGAGAGQKGAGRRHPAVKSAAIVCIDLSTGKRIWRTALTAPNNRVTQLSYSDGVLGVYAAYPATTGAGDSSTNFMAALDPDNGSWLWKGDARMGLAEKWSSAGNAPMNFAIREGHFFNIFKQKYYELDARTGARINDVILNLPNNRCLRPFMTPNLVVMGFGAYVKKNHDWCFTNIARSTCGSSGFPAYGQIFNGPNGECGCFTRLRNATALSCEVLRGDAPDSMRLEIGTAPAPSATAGTVVQPDSFPRGGYFPSRKPVITGKPILDDWHNNDYLPVSETAPLKSGDRLYVGIVNEHRLECRQGATVLWRYTTGGRISNPPVLTHGLCIFGSHDGYVYAVRQSDGKLVWRFLAARNERRICAFSQLESSHPVYGLIVHNGTVCVSAGRHPEIDGGIYVWGLQPDKGRIIWKSVIRTDIPWVGKTSKAYQ